MKTIYLARHGQTNWNQGSRFQGHRDIPLNEKGRSQAQALCERLSGVTFEAIFSSDLVRAKQTALTVAQHRKMTVVTDSRLREMNFGAWEGLTYQEIKDNHPQELSAWEKDLMSVSPPQGETLVQVISRVDTFRQEILEKGQGNILVVGHGGSMQVMICLLLDHDPAGYWQFHLSQASLSIIALYDLGGILNLHNDASHLEKGLPSSSGKGA